MSKMEKKKKKNIDVPERKPCFSEDWIKKEKTYKDCDEEVKTPFSWWCNPKKEGGYQFLEEHPSFSAERYYRVPWHPTFADRRDDTWPFNCDPLRCVNFKEPRCLKKLIYGDKICYKKPCKKYRLKAPLFSLPKNLGEVPKCRICCYTHACRGQPKTSNRCRIHCVKSEICKIESKEQTAVNEQKDCQCSIPTTHLSVQTTGTEFKDSSCDPASQSSGEDAHCLSSELLRELDGTGGEVRNEHLLEARYSCPAKTKAGDQPVCLLKEALKDYRSCQQLMNENRKKVASGGGASSNPFLKYLRCFDLEKDTMEYIHKCLNDSQKDEPSSCSKPEVNTSTKVLFEKIVDEKMETIGSILEISDNMKDVIGKDDLFSMLANSSLPEDITEDLKIRYKNLFVDKLQRLNSVLEMTAKMRRAINKGEILALLDDSNEDLLEGSIDTTVTNLNRRLFLDKLARIHSIIELTEKMKTAIGINDYEAILFDDAESIAARSMREGGMTDEGKVDSILRPPTEVEPSTRDTVEPSIDDRDSDPENHKMKEEFTPNISAVVTDRKNVEFEEEREVPKENKTLIAPCNSKRFRVDIGHDMVKSKQQSTVIKIDLGVRGNEVEVVKTSVEYEPVLDQSRFTSKPLDYRACPSSYFEIDTYLKGLKALITTYDPFLSPYSPMRDKIYARKMHMPKKMVDTKKCFPLSHNGVRLLKEKTTVRVPEVKNPISVLPRSKAEALYQQPCRPRDIEKEMKKWKENWTGRRMDNCSNASRKKCPYGIH